MTDTDANTDDKTVDEKHLREVTVKLLALGPVLPKFLSDLDVWQRGALVGAMTTYLDMPPEVVGALITDPEAVEVAFGEPVPDEDDEVVLDEAIYVTAAALAERGYNVGPSLGAVGMDWPRGSGNYHGGGPLTADATAEEVAERHGSFLAAIHELQEGKHE